MQAIEIIMRQHACAAHTAAKILNARAVRSHTPMQTLAAQIVAEAAVVHAGPLVSVQAADATTPTDTSLAVAIIMQESACDSAAAAAELEARAASHGLTAAEVAGAIVRLAGRQRVS